jgi:hypothetical protein
MRAYFFLTLFATVIALGGCSGATGPTDGGTGDPAYVPSGTGGQGSGPTGTGGSAPGENPGAGLPGDNGTGN